jgi:hypothetical protein
VSEYREEMGHCFESWAKTTGTEGALTGWVGLGRRTPLPDERLGLNSLTKPIRMYKIGRNQLRTVTISKTERLDVDQFEMLYVNSCDAERGGTRCSTGADQLARTYAERAGSLCAYRVGLGQE